MHCLEYPSLAGASGTTFSASTTPTAQAIPPGAQMVHIWADPDEDIYVRTGDSEVVGDNTGFPIPAGSGLTAFRTGYHKSNGSTHLTIYCGLAKTIKLIYGG